MTGPNPWVAQRPTRPHTTLRLFCFPYAGGGASAFRGWADGLPPFVDVCPVQLPGRESRFTEAAVAEIDELLPPLLAGLQPLLHDVPFAFFGYSMGALIAFEAARALRRERAPQPAQLFLGARRAPHLPPSAPVAHLPKDAFVREVGRLNGLPAEILQDEYVLGLFLPVLRADFALCERYMHRREPPLPCAFSLYGGTDDPDVSRADLEAWGTESEQSCTVRLFDGDHFFIRRCRDELLAALRHDIARLQGRRA